MPEQQKPTDRLNYSGNLEPVINRLCASYNIGAPDEFSVIETGYEDCNVVIETKKDKFLAKIFAKTRKPNDISRYTAIMQKVLEAGVHHPELVATTGGNQVYTDSEANGITLVLMRYVEGKTFLELERAPNDDELRAVVEQAAKVNSIDYKPPYIFDSWAIPNIKTMFGRVKQFIEPDDLKLVEQVVQQYEQIPVDDLPHVFVHGDLTKANIVKADNGDIYVLDFSVANWYPRTQELAVIVANLMHDKNDRRSLKEKCELVSKLYSQFGTLTEEERKHLLAYALAGISMEMLGGLQEKYINGHDSEETAFWIETGREGLRKALG